MKSTTSSARTSTNSLRRCVTALVILLLTLFNKSPHLSGDFGLSETWRMKLKEQKTLKQSEPVSGKNTFSGCILKVPTRIMLNQIQNFLSPFHHFTQKSEKIRLEKYQSYPFLKVSASRVDAANVQYKHSLGWLVRYNHSILL